LTRLVVTPGASLRVLLRFALIAVIAGCNTTQRAFDAAARQNTEQAYREFIQSHEEHPIAEEARRRLEALVWQAAASATDAKVIERFIAEFPNTARASEANERLESLQRQRAYRCASGMRAGSFFILPPGSSNITFEVAPDSAKDQKGPYGHVCTLKVRQSVTVVQVEEDGLLCVSKEGIEAVDESGGASYVSKRVGDEDSPILFVHVEQ